MHAEVVLLEGLRVVGWGVDNYELDRHGPEVTTWACAFPFVWSLVEAVRSRRGDRHASSDHRPRPAVRRRHRPDHGQGAGSLRVPRELQLPEQCRPRGDPGQRGRARLEQLVVQADSAAPPPGGAGARHLRQQEHELADVRSAAGQQRLLRVRADLRRHRRHPARAGPARWARRHRDQRRRAQDVRGQGAGRHRCEAGRHRRPLPGHPDARLLAEVPRRCAVRARLRLARSALARHQPRLAAAARGGAEGLRARRTTRRAARPARRCRPARRS